MRSEFIRQRKEGVVKPSKIGNGSNSDQTLLAGTTEDCGGDGARTARLATTCREKFAGADYR
jgi:hypothetical protein